MHGGQCFPQLFDTQLLLQQRQRFHLVFSWRELPRGLGGRTHPSHGDCQLLHDGPVQLSIVRFSRIVLRVGSQQTQGFLARNRFGQEPCPGLHTDEPVVHPVAYATGLLTHHHHRFLQLRIGWQIVPLAPWHRVDAVEVFLRRMLQELPQRIHMGVPPRQHVVVRLDGIHHLLNSGIVTAVQVLDVFNGVLVLDSQHALVGADRVLDGVDLALQAIDEPQVIVQILSGSHVADEHLVEPGAQPVDASVALHHANWIPMEVIVDEDGRVLQVLPLRQHIRREQVVQFLLGSGKHTLLGHRREASHDIVQVGGGCGQEGRLSVEIGNDVFQSHRQSHPQIIDGVGVSAEDQYLIVHHEGPWRTPQQRHQAWHPALPRCMISTHRG